jgi:DNA-binding XRE family transcriptional regulator
MKKDSMTLQQYFEKYRTPQRHFAKMAGISTATLTALLKKRSLPSLSTAYDIEKATDGLVTLYDWFEVNEIDGDCGIDNRDKKTKKH